jgi:hypothetical protein
LTAAHAAFPSTKKKEEAMPTSTMEFDLLDRSFTQPKEIPMSCRYSRSFVTAAIGALCLSFLLGACGGDSGSTGSDSGPPAELRDYPYCEVIPDTISGDTLTEHIFNTLPFGPCQPKEFLTVTEADVVDAYDAAYGASSTGATINGPRHWVLDTLTSTGGVTSSGETLTVNGIKFGLVGQLQTAVGSPTIGTDPYVVNTVQRNTIYTFKKGLQVFELTDPSGNVYVMQSYSQQVDSSLSLEKLPDIGPTDRLKEGWSYAARRLTEDLTLTASGSTQIVNDYYENTYQINPAAN